MVIQGPSLLLCCFILDYCWQAFANRVDDHDWILADATEKCPISAARLPSRSVAVLSGWDEKVKNGPFYERRDAEYLVRGVPTYWNPDASQFIYWCERSRQWVVFSTKSGEGLEDLENKKGCRGMKFSPKYPIRMRKILPGVWGPGEAGVDRVERSCGDRSSEDECLHDGCQWDVLEGICTVERPLFRGPPRFSDVAQGALGNCYFLAVLAAVALRHPELIKRAFVEDPDQNLTYAYAQHRVHRTRWLIVNQPTTVAVDEWVPVSKAGLPVFGSAGFQSIRKLDTKKHISGVVWPVILEKAWAKIHGNFKSIESGGPFEPFRALTGAPVDVLDHGRSSRCSPDIALEKTSRSLIIIFTFFTLSFSLLATHMDPCGPIWTRVSFYICFI